MWVFWCAAGMTTVQLSPQKTLEWGWREGGVSVLFVPCYWSSAGIKRLAEALIREQTLSGGLPAEAGPPIILPSQPPDLLKTGLQTFYGSRAPVEVQLGLQRHTCTDCLLCHPDIQPEWEDVWPIRLCFTSGSSNLELGLIIESDLLVKMLFNKKDWFSSHIVPVCAHLWQNVKVV